MTEKYNLNLSRSSRVKRGFHRIGIVLFVICMIISFMVGVRDIWNYGYIIFRYNTISESVFCMFIGLSFYVLSRSIGWIIAGFFRD
jgi:hypothetical protein